MVTLDLAVESAFFYCQLKRFKSVSVYISRPPSTLFFFVSQRNFRRFPSPKQSDSRVGTFENTSIYFFSVVRQRKFWPVLKNFRFILFNYPNRLRQKSISRCQIVAKLPTSNWTRKRDCCLLCVGSRIVKISSLQYLIEN